VLNDVLAILEVSIRESGAVVTAAPLPTVMADPAQLLQVFQNLIGNAIKYRGERPPEVFIDVEHRAGEWQFTMRDNGIGIDPQYFERIFGIFQRLHTRREYPGTGIGLALCKKIIERHGGRIWVASKPEEGSTFFFTIPDRRWRPMPLESPHKPIEILLVEDSPSDVLMAKAALESAKLLFDLHVEDGEQALAFLRHEGLYANAPRPALILLDLNLPRKDGREVLTEIKADDRLRRIPVVVLTTSKAEEDILKAYGLHANCYITKPIDFGGFAEVVRAVEHFWFSVVTLPPE
jgi:two-component system, chemotaxis family, response regulator Rcp1